MDCSSKTNGRLKIHSENILPIIKQWLYTDREIFVRELVSNACDALHKVKILRDQGKCQAVDSEFRIDIHIDKEAKTLTFSDTGVGMTAEEVEKYIAQIAFSGAEDFVERYQSKDEKDQMIGHFGLGFYSSYMVAGKVEIQTLSGAEGSKPARWSCDGSPDYLLEEGTRETRGTEITLHMSEEGVDFLDATHLRTTLNKYCNFLPYPVYLDDSHINAKEPLWIKPASECSKNDYLEFYRYLYPMEEDPLFWIHLNVDYPFNLKGILYFPKVKRDASSHHQSVNLYCNRVFVADNCKDIFPEYLTALRGVVDSPDIPLNVSRSSLQTDRTVRQLSGHISKKVADSLAAFYRNDRDGYIASWPDVELVLKLGCVEDSKFYERAKDLLIWKNTDGEWTTLQDYLERNKDKTKDKIFYTSDQDNSGEFIELYRSRGIEVLHTNPYLDSMVIGFLESKLDGTKFQRVDGAIDENLLDASREKTVLDADGRTEAAKLADLIRSKFNNDQVEVEAKSLASDSVPGFVMIDEQQRRLRDYMRRMDNGTGAVGDQLGKHSFVVNTNNPLIQALPKLDAQDPELAGELVHELYELSRLAQREIDADGLQRFIRRTTDVLAKLTTASCQ